ncbi:MAG TPA: hypothetical protein VNH64_03755 [Parvularculaceae bacterium]|nr:hypothetical protein [Parvularculaceae bacterium]
MVDISSVVAVLDRIHGELSAEYPYHAGLAVSLAEEVQRDFGAAGARYCSAEWWGGAGSMFDIAPSDRVMRRRLAVLLVELVEQFDRVGIRCASAASGAEILKKWLAAGAI